MRDLRSKVAFDKGEYYGWISPHGASVNYSAHSSAPFDSNGQGIFFHTHPKNAEQFFSATDFFSFLASKRSSTILLTNEDSFLMTRSTDTCLPGPFIEMLSAYERRPSLAYARLKKALAITKDVSPVKLVLLAAKETQVEIKRF